jgi:hypothetical protein
MDVQLVPTLFDYSLTDGTAATETITKEKAEKLFAACSKPGKFPPVKHGCSAAIFYGSILVD